MVTMVMMSLMMVVEAVVDDASGGIDDDGDAFLLLRAAASHRRPRYNLSSPKLLNCTSSARDGLQQCCLANSLLKRWASDLRRRCACRKPTRTAG
eukprot:6094014-Pyramimonas_sp.AAC.1